MFGIVSLLLCIAYPRPRRYVQKCRLMRCMLVIISITRCPFSYKVSKTHTILSNMKKHENDNLWCLFIKSIESPWPAFLDVSETIIVCPIKCIMCIQHIFMNDCRRQFIGSLTAVRLMHMREYVWRVWSRHSSLPGHKGMCWISLYI